MMRRSPGRTRGIRRGSMNSCASRVRQPAGEGGAAHPRLAEAEVLVPEEAPGQGVLDPPQRSQEAPARGALFVRPVEGGHSAKAPPRILPVWVTPVSTP